MNWEALGAIGELVGALGVIATLAYLAVQIRQNTRAVRSSTLNEVTRAQVAELRWSSDIAGAFRRAVEDPESMSADDTWQVTEWMTAAFLARQNEMTQHEQGLLDGDQWERSQQILRLLCGIPWVQRWWHSYGRQVFTGAFVARVDEIMRSESADHDYAEAFAKLQELSK